MKTSVRTTLVLLLLLLGFERSAHAQFSATGGTVTTSGSNTIHTFLSSGTFTPNGSGTVEVLVVGGGGGGGTGYAYVAGGGGGGGGVVYNGSYAVTAGTMGVTVGHGGAGGTIVAGAVTTSGPGGNSIFGSITAVGGGKGGRSPLAGGSGGSGGGGADGSGGGSGTSGQGYAGGNGNGSSPQYGSGGGGGAGAAGTSGTYAAGGAGGAGVSNSISGSSVYYGGGGGGGSLSSSAGNGGNGGGGNGNTGTGNGAAGTPNRGGGGGGGGGNSAYVSTVTGGTGGSGIVIIRYPTPGGGGGSSITLNWKRDHIYAGPGGGLIATVTPPPSDATAPTAPSSLGVTSTTATSVALSWTGSSDGGSGMAGYKIYRQKGSGANLPIGTVNSSTTAFTDHGPLEPNVGYNYTIVAFDNAQNHSSASNSVNLTTSASSGDTTAPSTPTGLAVTLTSRNSVHVRWLASTDTGGSGLRGYKLYRGTTLISGTNPITATSFVESGLSYSTTYAYKVEAVDFNSNTSAQTTAVNITTQRQLLFEDTFTREDSETLGSGWNQSGQGIGVNSGYAKASNMWTWGMATRSPGTSNFKLSVSFVNGFTPITLFVSSSGGIYAGYVAQSYAGVLYVLQCTNLLNETCTEVASTSGGSSSGLSVEVNSTSRQISLNGGALVYTIPETESMSGEAGVLVYTSSIAMFDNVVFESN
jgi:hypothetical protein